MKKLTTIAVFAILMAMAACGGGGTEERKTVKTPDVVAHEKAMKEEKAPAIDPMTSKGIGPVSEVTLGETIDQGMVAEGQALFEKNCAACHKTDKKYIGPAPKDILDRRTPEWVMNMIMNPTEMVQKDPIAKQVLAEANGAIMADQNISEVDARKILEYFRTL
ncbi:c-type cytochrome [Owenweeksia hongkongensis]|uniref:c-type cytochrome n=1 Tax=Owenweeksia hongkongensis TaxID=253245 RepID=UPI003A946413